MAISRLNINWYRISDYFINWKNHIDGNSIRVPVILSTDSDGYGIARASIFVELTQNSIPIQPVTEFKNKTFSGTHSDKEVLKVPITHGLPSGDFVIKVFAYSDTIQAQNPIFATANKAKSSLVVAEDEQPPSAEYKGILKLYRVKDGTEIIQNGDTSITKGDEINIVARSLTKNASIDVMDEGRKIDTLITDSNGNDSVRYTPTLTGNRAINVIDAPARTTLVAVVFVKEPDVGGGGSTGGGSTGGGGTSGNPLANITVQQVAGGVVAGSLLALVVSAFTRKKVKKK